MPLVYFQQLDQIDTSSVANFADTNDNARAYPVLSLQCVWSGVTGIQPAFKLQASNDGTNFDDIPYYTHTTVGAADSHTFQLDNYSALYYRVQITTASTTGALDVYVFGNAKGR